MLTKQGARVAIIEQHIKIGGFCTSWERCINVEGQTFRYIFDAGVHDIFGLGPHGHVRSLLNDLGVQDKIEWRRVEHQYIFPDLQIQVPSNIEDYITLLCKTFPHERNGIIAFFQEIRECFSELYTEVTKRPHVSRWINVPFSKMVESFIQDRRLKKLLSILYSYITDDVSKVDSLTMIPLFGYYLEGGYYPVGGSQVFPDLLANFIIDNGGEILTNAAVSRISIVNKNIAGIELADGSNLHSEIVISNADLRRTFLDLIDPNQLPTHFLHQIKRLRPSNSAFLVSLGVDFVPKIQTVTLLNEENEYVGIVVPSNVDPSLAPVGHACITLMKLIPNAQAVTWDHNETGYRARKEKFGNSLIMQAEKVIPELSKHIVYRQDASPATFARYTWTSDGGIYGTTIGAWKPSSKTPLSGLYLASASISTRPGVADAVYSGMVCSEAILRQKRYVSFFKN